MGYNSLEQCILDLEKNGHLIRVKEEVDANLEMAEIHRQVYAKGGPALFFENVKDCQFRSVSNLYGTIDRSKFMFRDTIDDLKRLLSLKANPDQILKTPFQYWKTPFLAFKGLPKKVRKNRLTQTCNISDLPQIKSWPMDGGAFVTLPEVYSEDIDNPGVMKSNLGMYRIQLSGNDYIQDKEIGLHYQLHRGIGVHQTKANAKGQPFRVCVFVGGPPSMPLAAVMPLPEGLPEVAFAGVIGNKRFEYKYINDFCIAQNVDFVITGLVYPNENKPEGPFGDHLGYYSLTHDFPVMKVENVYHKPNAIWPFTVVGRPPQEDTSFGALIHDLVGEMVPATLPGVKEVRAVDAAGVHPLLFAIGSERYTPYLERKRPQELLTIANSILGFGQLSLAKFLFIAAKEDDTNLSTHDEVTFLQHILCRIDLTRDVHFHTKSTIDTLDYSGDGLNTGSKVVFAATGEPIRTLSSEVPQNWSVPSPFYEPKVIMDGVLAIETPQYIDESTTQSIIDELSKSILNCKNEFEGFPLIILTENSQFLTEHINNFVWVTFTRSNPSHDIYGVDEFIDKKHWGCNGSIIIDSRIKPHHAPPLVEDEKTLEKVAELSKKGKSLYDVL